MTPTPVGMRCPECARQRTQVHTMRSLGSEPRVTIALIIVNVALFVATRGLSGGSGPLWRDLYLDGPDVAIGHDYYRLVTGGFLHSGIFHIGFNMYLLWLLGQLLEPVLGSRRFAALYFTSLLCGSFGALLLTPNVPTVGASGAIFGLMGAAAVELRSRGINPFRTTIGMLIIFNLALSFVVSNVSVGGHIGGLVGGVLVGVVFEIADRRRAPRPLAYAACVALSAVAVLAAISVA